MVYLLEDVKKAKKKRGSPIRRTVERSQKVFNHLLIATATKKCKKCLSYSIFWVCLRVTKFNCGETRAIDLEMRAWWGVQVQVQISSIKYQIQGRLLGGVWKGKHVQVQAYSIVYQVSNIKHQVSLLGGCEPGEVLEDQFLPVLRKALWIRRGVMERWKGVDVYISIFVYLENFCGLGGEVVR